MKVKVEMTPEEMIAAVQCYEELKAYRKTGYTPERIAELLDEHWGERRQIAEYDDELNGNRGWIPCSERMPEKGVEVLVCANRNDKEEVFTAYAAYDNYRWFTGHAFFCKINNEVNTDVKITHWMLLPKPPVEEKTE